MNFVYETQGTSTFLVYQKQDDEIIDTVSVGMISNNKIEGIIPAVYVQMDDVVSFKYNVSALNTLEQYFSGVVGKKRFLTALNSIMKVFMQAEDYMLEPSSFVLELPYIFVNPVTSEASLIVLPVLRETNISVEQFVRNLVFSIQFDQTEECSYIAAVISFLNANKFFSAADLKNLTEKLLKEEKGFSGQNAILVEKDMSTAKKVVSEPVQKAIPAPKPKSIVPSEPEAVPVSRSGFTPAEKKIPVPAKREEPKEEGKGILSKKKSLFGKKEKKPKGKAGGSFGGMTVPGMDIPVNEEQTGTISNGSPESLHISVPAQKVPVQKHAVRAQNFGETVDLRSYMEGTSPAGETTILNTPPQEQPFFLNVRTQEKYVIIKEISRIGKDRGGNDFCIQGNTAVSRCHASIHMQGGQVYVEDNGSTNGTFVDGMKLVPKTRSKALQNGSHVRLGNEELEFRTHE